MNLKKAFRYQTLINNIISVICKDNLREDSFRTISVTYKKSELNTYALNKTYEDEVKVIQPGRDLPNNIPASMIYEYDFRSKPSSENYNPIIVLRVLKYLLDEKAKVSEAIFKAKTKTKIIPIGFQTSITYDSAISLAATCRKFMSASEILKPKLKDKTINLTDTASVITSVDQPLASVKYNVEVNVNINQDTANTLADYTKEISTFVEDLSDKIEAAALSANVNYVTDLAVLDNFDSLYRKFESNQK